MKFTRRAQGGFTLVELLVVITIIGILVSLLLPAVQISREAARRVQCQNHLKQMGIACLSAQSSAGHFPSGGWGWWWVGDADWGNTKHQPGGWTFVILPHLEQMGLYQQAGDNDREAISATQKDGANKVVTTPVVTFNCPTRRRVQLVPKPVDGLFVAYNATNNPTGNNFAARSDYAINCGDQGNNEFWGGPNPGSNTMSYVSDNTAWHDTSSLTGISFERSEIRPAHVRDGLANTYLVGEKYLDPNHYASGSAGADNETWCTGYNNDNFRNASSPPNQDRKGANSSTAFGSAHSSGVHFVFCDGSVQTIRYTIDAQVHKNLANRDDDNGNSVIPP